MQRGFKKWAEEQARDFRCCLGLAETQRLAARDLANHLGIVIITPALIPGMSSAHLNQLLHKDPNAWSALTISAESQVVIIHNDTHTVERQESNLMHEMAHVICKHEPTSLSKIGPFMTRTFEAEQEEEATWLGASLQLPRVALSWAASCRMDKKALASYFGASEPMVRYRINVTGLRRQFQNPI